MARISSPKTNPTNQGPFFQLAPERGAASLEARWPNIPRWWRGFFFATGSYEKLSCWNGCISKSQKIGHVYTIWEFTMSLQANILKKDMWCLWHCWLFCWFHLAKRSSQRFWCFHSHLPCLFPTSFPNVPGPVDQSWFAKETMCGWMTFHLQVHHEKQFCMSSAYFSYHTVDGSELCTSW